MAYLALSVPGDARVISDILVAYTGDAQLGTLVEYADGARRRRVDRVLIFEPHDFGRGGAVRLAVQDNGVAQIYINNLFGRDDESRRR